MNEKIFVKEKSKTPLIAIIIIVGLISGFFGSTSTYVILNNKYGYTSQENGANNTNNINRSETKYEISQVENPVVAIAQEVGPSIVFVKVEFVTQGVFGILQDSGSEGSGIIYSDDGYIITNYHVISSALSNSMATITVTLPNSNEEIPATIVGGDKVTDLAVLKIDKKGLTKAKFGKSSDVKVGEIAVAIGNPLGEELASTITGGYISAVNRKITTEGRTYNLIQTDAAINPGNSGGALVNSKGEVIGINTIKISDQGVEGLGFAIPVDEALPIISQLITNKKISRPYIGISGFDLDKEIAKKYNLVEGVYISEINPNTPAQKSGLKKGDVITEFNGKAIKTMNELNALKNDKKVGDTVSLKVYRKSGYVDITVTLEEDTSVE
ncbi:MAG: trypsin-like peptidase domain-containing protein [Clostridia bacterium]|nr:trypsin-like peptidase domain-containing protein [Clostridia bacterium]